MNDVLTWAVAYADDTVLHEFDEGRPDGRGWAEIGEKPVKIVMLATAEVNQVYRVAIPAGATPVFFRRRAIAFNLTGDQQTNLPVTHCIGWKSDEDAAYLFVFENGETLLTNELQAV